MIFGVYTLDLYCDCCERWERSTKAKPVKGPHPRQYVGSKLSVAMRHARSEGWTFRKGMCRCRECGSEGRAFPEGGDSK